MDREKVIKALELCSDALYCADPSSRCSQCPYRTKDMTGTDERNCSDILMADALALLKEQEAKQYNNHEVACIIADLFGDTCACNFNDIDTWLPYKCDFRETCCPNPVGVACWEQYLKHKESR